MSARPGTNITLDHKAMFEALRDPGIGNLALYSCFVDGRPASAIVAIAGPDADDRVKIAPLFVSVTPDMVLTDHDGHAA